MEENSGRKRKGYRDAEGPTTSKPPRGRQGPGCRPRAANGGVKRHGNSSRRKHAAQGTGTSGGGWRETSEGGFQVGGASHQERRWGEGEN